VPARIRPPEPLGQEPSARRHNSAFSSREGAIVTLSPEGQAAAARAAEDLAAAFGQTGSAEAGRSSRVSGEPASETSSADQGEPAAEQAAPATGPKTPGELAPEEQQVVEELRKRDAEVRAHEAAHAGAAGSLGGSPSYSYETGPDGRRYAVGGEVHIDVSQGATPQETIANAQQVRAAALAPASPSSQDRAVAASAAAMEQKARAELSRDRAEAAEGADGSGDRDPFQATDAAGGAPDPDRLMMSLASERTQAFGNYGHAHLNAGCGFCGKAAATYR